MTVRNVADLYADLGIKPISGGSPESDPPKGENPPGADPPKGGDPSPGDTKGGDDPKPDAVTFTAEQVAEMNRRIAAARKDGKSDAERAAAERAEQERQERERQAAIERGEFDTVKAELDKTIADMTAERDALAAKVGRYEQLAKERIESAKSSLPAEAVEDFDADADPLDQLAWLEGRAALVKRLVPTDTKPPVTIPATPPATGDPNRVNDEDARRRVAAQYRDF